MKKKIVISLTIILAIVGAVVVIAVSSMPDMSPIYKSKTIMFKDRHAPVYLKSQTWGLTYDSKEIVLSTNQDEEAPSDTTKDYIFRGATLLYYKVSSDTLCLYVYSKAKVPPMFGSDIHVIQTELENPDMIRLQNNDTYKSKGLIRFE